MMHITVKKTPSGEVHPFEVDGTRTVQQLKDLYATVDTSMSKNFSLYLDSKYLPVVKTLVDAGITDGGILEAKPRAHDPKQRSEARINKMGTRPKRGGVARSIKYDIRASKEDVLDAVAAEGVSTRRAIGACENVLMGEPVPRKPGQTDKARLKQLRTQKRVMDNEVSDLREKEGVRIAQAQQRNKRNLAVDAEVADGAVQLVLEVDTREELVAKKQEWMDQQKAQRNLLAAREKQFRAEERAAVRMEMARGSDGVVGPAVPAAKRAKRNVATTNGSTDEAGPAAPAAKRKKRNETTASGTTDVAGSTPEVKRENGGVA